MNSARILVGSFFLISVTGACSSDKDPPLPLSMDGGIVFGDGGMPDAPAACTPIPTDCSAPIPLTSAELAGGKILPPRTCYTVAQNLNVSAGTLSVGAGVVIQFATGTSMRVQAGGQLKLAGTCDAPIRFTSTDPVASWKGVHMDNSQGSDNTWTFAVIDRAGAGQWTGAADSDASLYLTGMTTLVMDHVSITNGKSHGLVALENVTFTFTNGSLTGNVTPAYLHPNVADRIPEGVDLTTNTNPYIRVVFGNNDKVTGTRTWAPYTYRVESRFSVDGALTIAAGATLQFAQDVSMIINVGATLVAKGTAEKPVTFAGASNTRGFWQGIEVKSGGTGVPVIVGATFDHCVIQDAGGRNWSGAADSRAALYLDDTSAAVITNTTFRNSAHYGLWASNKARLPGFAMNTFSGNARVMIVHPDRVGELAGNSTLTGNDEDTIRVAFGNTDRVTTAATWKNPGVPYFVTARIFIEAPLIIDPGVTLRFAQGVGMHVKEMGSLTTNGTAALPVKLLGQSEVATGYWQGVRIESNVPQNSLNFTTISHAGAVKWTGAPESDGAIFLEAGTQIALNNVTLGPGGGYGIVLGGANSMLGCTAVTFDNLVKGAIYKAATPAGLLTMCP